MADNAGRCLRRQTRAEISLIDALDLDPITLDGQRRGDWQLQDRRSGTSESVRLVNRLRGS